ncbi:B12-binding domain-containing radical SAM protein [Nanoarchaeota archaeon]
MSKVLLVYANSFMDNLIPIGPSLLSSCLKKAGHETALFDTTFYRTREKTGDEARVESLQVKETNLEELGITEKKENLVKDFHKSIDSFKPDLIGVSVVEPTYHIALNLLNSIKDLKTPKIVGGIHATMGLEDILKEDSIDMICVGEGEKAIVDLANKIRSKEDYSRTDNIWLKKDGGIIKNPLAPLADLDSLPDQDWSIYEKKRFFKPMGGKINISGPVELNRGCTYHCAFCCNDKLQAHYKGIGRYPRQRSIENFMSELKTKKEEFGLEYLYLVAENFLQMGPKRFDDFIKGYKEIGLPFWIETRPETVKLDRVSKLKEIGCEGISIGLEHGNDEFRRKMLNRYVDNKKIINAFEIARQSGIRICANNIIGFPEETRDLVFDTIQLNRDCQADNLITNIFCAYRGTPLWDHSVKKGYIPREGYAGDYRSDAGLDMPQLNREQVKGLQRTFPLYVRFQKEMWPKIELAEKFDQKGNEAFLELSKIYKKKYM